MSRRHGQSGTNDQQQRLDNATGQRRRRFNARHSLYLVALAASCASFGMALAALLQPNWVQFSTPPSTSPVTVHSSFGLFQRCDSSSWTGDAVVCRKFPTQGGDCVADLVPFVDGDAAFDESTLRTGQLQQSASVEASAAARKRLGKQPDDDEWSFCDSWVTAGYAQQMSLVFGASAILASLVVLLGGRHKRETGWRIVAGLLGVHAALLIISTSLIAHEYTTDDRFYFGSRLGQGYIISTTSWAMDVLVVGALVSVGLFGLIKEDDYEPIGD